MIIYTQVSIPRLISTGIVMLTPWHVDHPTETGRMIPETYIEGDWYVPRMGCEPQYSSHILEHLS